MSDPKPTATQLLPHERAQSVIVSTPTEMYLFSVGMDAPRGSQLQRQRAWDRFSEARVVVIKDDHLPDLIAAMHAGSVFHIAQKSLAAKAKGAWIVNSISIFDPDEASRGRPGTRRR